MKLQELCSRYSTLLLKTLENSPNLFVILLDYQGIILDTTGGFRKLLDLPLQPIGRNLREYLWKKNDSQYLFPVTPPAFKLEDDPLKKYEEMRLRLRKPAQGTIYTVQAYVVDTGSGYLLFVYNPFLTESNVINQIAKINMEVTNISRELNRKNMALEEANATILSLMNTDDLTGLANRRYFREMFDKAVSFATRKNLPLAIIMTDLDRFKTINDTYGHDTGDEVLKAFGSLLKNAGREEDLAVRFGGEEFLIMLPGTDLQNAYHFAERVRKATAQLSLPSIHQSITASFGVAELKQAKDKRHLLQLADQAMYTAKNKGRNRTEKAPHI